jgi:hypothetical protein
MAQLNDKGLSGRIGPVIYYMVNGKQLVRAYPVARKKRTNATRKPAAVLFGLCSHVATSAGYALEAALPFPLTSMNTLRGWVYRHYKIHHAQTNWVLGQNFLPPCQLNPNADLREFLFVPIDIKGVQDGRLHIQVPAFEPAKQIRNPLRAASVGMKIMVQALSFGKTEEYFFADEQIIIDYSVNQVPAHDLFFEYPTLQPNTVLMVSVALMYRLSDGSIIKDNEYLPAAVIAMGYLDRL